MQRRTLLAAAALAMTPLATLANKRPVIEVWKTPDCGCCKDWLRHLESGGLDVKFHDLSPTRKNEQRRRLGLDDRYGSCHTGRVGGYVIEGHVPARDIHRLLREKPKALGLAVPGMPVGSPGMDGPEYGGHKDAYDVLLVQHDGSARVYQAYR
jgi:hypothetical protein